MAAVAPLWFTSVLGALLVSLLVAIALRWVKLPYTIALVLVGLVMGWLGGSLFTDGFSLRGILSAEIILYLLLPPLLFEGAGAMHISRLKQNWKTISLLAIPGVLVNTTVIGLLCWQLVWPDAEHGMLYGLLIGSILAATDPVSVLALVKSLGAPKRLSVLIEGESLFNDGTAVVLFGILLATTLDAIAGTEIVLGAVMTQGIASFLMVVTVGTVTGLICGMVANHLLNQTEDHLVEIALTVALAFGAFLVAELLHGSGVISVVVAGLLVGNHGVHHGMTATARIGMHHFWEVVCFLVNSVLFLLVGYELQSVIAWDAHTWFLAAVAIGSALVARLILFPLTTIANIGDANPISGRWQVAMWWGGLRGSIPLALLLLISHIVHDGQIASGPAGDVLVFLDESVYHDMLVLAFSVVLFTLVVQGLTMKPLMNRLGIGGKLAESEVQYEATLADLVASRAALRKLSAMSTQGLVSEDDRVRLGESYRTRVKEAEAEIESLSEMSVVHASRVEAARKEMIQAQIDALREAERAGQLSNVVTHHLLKSLDGALGESEHHREEITKASEDEADEQTEDGTSHEALIPETTDAILSSTDEAE